MAVRVSQTALGAVSIGPPVQMNWQASPPIAQVLVVTTGVNTWSVEYTLDNIYASNSDNTPVFGVAGVSATWQPITALTGKSATTDATINFPVIAIRLNMTAWTSGGSILKVLQGDQI